MTNTLLKLHNEEIYISVETAFIEKFREILINENVQFEEFEVGKMPLEKLPIEIQEKVKSILKAYSEVNVTYENGQFKVSASYGIKSQYPKDHFVCGYYKATDVYTKEERKQNFIEEFGYTPAYMK